MGTKLGKVLTNCERLPLFKSPKFAKWVTILTYLWTSISQNCIVSKKLFIQHLLFQIILVGLSNDFQVDKRCT